MKILTLFIDMVRPNTLFLHNNSIKKNTIFDNYLINLGGTIYDNVISPGPDTPRALATYFSGEPPWINGCNSRCKWPYFFLDKKIYSNNQLFADNDYEQYFFTNPNERNIGMLPMQCESFKNNVDLNLKKFINELELKEKSHLFISIPDLHWTFDDFGYNKFSLNKGYKKIISGLNIIFDKFNPDKFDHIIIFSDHGFKFISEINYARKINPLYLYNEDRVKSFLFHRVKSQNYLSFNNQLLSLADIQKIYRFILNDKDLKINLQQREFVCYEDHLNFGYSNFMETEIFGYVDNKKIYIRGFDKCLTLDRNGNFISNKFSVKIDQILKTNTSFGMKINYFNKLPPQQNRLFVKQNQYIDGSKRLIKKHKITQNIKTLINKIVLKCLRILNHLVH